MVVAAAQVVLEEDVEHDACAPAGSCRTTRAQGGPVRSHRSRSKGATRWQHNARKRLHDLPSCTPHSSRLRRGFANKRKRTQVSRLPRNEGVPGSSPRAGSVVHGVRSAEACALRRSGLTTAGAMCATFFAIEKNATHLPSIIRTWTLLAHYKW